MCVTVQWDAYCLISSETPAQTSGDRGACPVAAARRGGGDICGGVGGAICDGWEMQKPSVLYVT